MTKSEPSKAHFKDLLLLKQFTVYTKPYKKILLGAFLCLFVLLGLDLLRPLILKETIDKAFPQKDGALVLEFALMYMVVIVLSAIMQFTQNYLFQYFGQNIIFEIRNKVFFNILSQTPQEFSSLPVGNLVTRITNDTESLRSLYTDVLLKMGRSMLLILGIVVVMISLNLKLAVISLCILPIMVGITLSYQKHARKAFRGVRSKVSATNAYVQEALNFIVVIKTYLGNKLIKDQHNDISTEFLKAGLFEVQTFSIFRPLVDFLYFVCIVAIFTFTNLFDSITEAGTVFAFIQYIDKFFQPIKEIAEKYNVMQSSLAGAERLVPILNQERAVELKEETIPEEFKSINDITFDHVWFSYSNDEVYALKDISFTIKAGEFIGIAGLSGSGKSTLMALLMGFYKPTKGKILINGYDTSYYSPRLIRELVGYVFQDSHLFKGTIKENLSLYDHKISQEKLKEAAQKASLHDMIKELPNQYDTSVGYLGSLLSSGQKQLLALARVLVNSYKILIFDEATANIDSDTERKIQASIESSRGEKTIISIAHRLSTIRSADCIYIMKHGEIVEYGLFEELLDQKGELYSLWSQQ